MCLWWGGGGGSTPHSVWRESDGGGEVWALGMGIHMIQHFLFENMCVLVVGGGGGLKCRELKEDQNISLISFLVPFLVHKSDVHWPQGGAGSEVWNRVYMIAPVKKFGRVGLCTNFIPNKHGGGEEGELAELAVI